MGSLLRKAGYSVLTAEDGLEGLTLARREQPDLVISDVSMPRMDGLEFCREMRADSELKTVPILLVSALQKDTESAVAGLQAGADDYLEIPFDSARLDRESLAPAGTLAPRSELSRPGRTGHRHDLHTGSRRQVDEYEPRGTKVFRTKTGRDHRQLLLRRVRHHSREQRVRRAVSAARRKRVSFAISLSPDQQPARIAGST